MTKEWIGKYVEILKMINKNKLTETLILLFWRQHDNRFNWEKNKNQKTR